MAEQFIDWEHPNARYYERLVKAYVDVNDDLAATLDFPVFKAIYDRSSLDQTRLADQRARAERQAQKQATLNVE